MAKREKETKVKECSVQMPLQFETKSDYVAKLTELLFIEAECERLNTEFIAEKNIRFSFKERLAIYCTLWMQVPKTI